MPVDFTGVMGLDVSRYSWKCFRQQQPVAYEEEDKKPAKASQPSKGLGLSWDLGSSTSTMDDDIMAMLTKMETKNSPKPKIHEVVETSIESPSIAPGIPITDASRVQVSEYFLDVRFCVSSESKVFEEPEEKKKKPMRIEMEGVMEGEGKEVYDHDKGMSRLLKFNSIIKRNPSQILRY